MRTSTLPLLPYVVLFSTVCGCSSGPAVEIAISDAHFKEIENWPNDVVFLTSAKDPITTFEGLEDDQIAIWGMELVVNVQNFLALSGRPDTPVGLNILGTGHDDANFNENPKLKLFITHENAAQGLIDRGGARIKLVSQ